MATQSEAVQGEAPVLRAVRGAVAELPTRRYVIAVSGGRDSMVLLDAFAVARPREIAAVATFDHGTGPAARRSAELVEHAAMSRSLPVVSGSAAAAVARTEAAWREARWRFLRAWAEELNAVVVTAHTRDDQIETVVLRLLRESGVRGLAGMRAESDGIARPLITLARDTIAQYAEAAAVRWIEDPSNQSLAHQRNRVRLELLPALERAVPGFGDYCWSLGERAAAWRRDLDAIIDSALAPTLAADGAVVLRAAPTSAFRASEWAVLWPALAARAGVVMDWRGVDRASAWAPRAKVGSEIPLSGGAHITRTAATFVIRAASHSHASAPGNDPVG